MTRLARKPPAHVARRRSRPVKSQVRREKAVVTLTYNAVIERHGDGWIGWIRDVPGVNCQEKTRAALLKTLRVTLAEALEFQQAGALRTSDEDFLEAAVHELGRSHLRSDPW